MENIIKTNKNLLVPRNLEGRKEKLKQLNIKLLSQEMIDGDLNLDESFMDIDARFVKLKIVNGHINLLGGAWTEIPEWLSDIEVFGNFICSFNKLESLKNCPKNIGRNFSCSYNQLVSLENCPQKVGANFWCNGNINIFDLPEDAEIKGKFFNYTL